MIQVSRDERGGAEVEARLLRQPAIYLDQDSLADLARNESRRKRFMDIWASKGELLFSWTNAFDLSGPEGDTATRIREFLDGLGPHWVPLEFNPWRVVRKEHGQEASSGTPCVSESFIRAYFLELGDDVTKLGPVVDLVQNDRMNTRLQLQEVKTAADSMAQAFRADFVRDASSIDQKLPALPYDPARPTTSLLRDLERLVAREARSYTWMPNDGVDFMHASVAAACADFLLLDKQWKRRVLAVAPSKTYPWVFYRHELDAFLDAFEACTVA